MSDFYQSGRYASRARSPYDSDPYSDDRPRRRPSPYRPIAQQIAAEVDKEKRSFRPVEAIFDFLSRGQYATANFVEDLVNDKTFMEALGGAWQGITGERKGDWEDVLFKGTPEEERNFGQKLAGFAANVLLDPTTYISFGATGAARAAARKFADDAAQRVVRGAHNLPASANVSREALSKGLGDIAQKASDDPAKLSRRLRRYFSPDHANDIARRADESWRDAYRRGLRMDADEMKRSWISDLEAEKALVQQNLTKSAKEVLKGKARPGRLDAREGRRRGTLGQVDLLDHLDERLRVIHGIKTGDDYAKVTDELSKLKNMAEREEWMDLSVTLAKAGERSGRFVTKEIGKSVRDPNFISRQVMKWGDTLRATRGGEKFTDAWWSVMNRGPVGKIRAVFGIRNAYQDLINKKYLDVQDLYQDTRDGYARDVDDILRGLSQEDQQMIVRSAEWSELEKNVKGTSGVAEAATRYPVETLTLRDPEQSLGLGQSATLYARRGLMGKDKVANEKVIRAAKKIEELMVRFQRSSEELVKKGYLDEHGNLGNYFPLYIRSLPGQSKTLARGIGGPSFTKRRHGTLRGAIAEEAATFSAVLGIPQELAERMVREHGLGDVVLDLKQVLLTRAHAQAKAESRGFMLDQFKHFGVDTGVRKTVTRAAMREGVISGEEINREAMNAMMRQDGGLPGSGIRGVTDNDGALAGYQFDSEVAAVLERVVKLTSSDESQNVLREGWRNFNAWWKSVVTASGGFHLRNFFSNQVTGFLKFGPDWFNAVKFKEASIATEYALGGWDGIGMKSIRKLLGDTKTRAILQKRRGGWTLEELSIYGRRNGVISTSTRDMASEDIDRYFDKFKTTYNPFATKFKGYEISRHVGARVESSARMHSFLLDLDRVSSKTPFASSHQLEYAKLQAKKWFMDYNDLTEAERGFFKNVIPFYSWLRKNTANQIAGIIENPQMYSLIPKGQAAIEARDPDFGKELYPEWWRDAGIFPIAQTPEGTLVFRPNFPYQEGLNLLPIRGDEDALLGFRLDWKDWKDTISQSLNPAIKSLIEVIPEKGYNTFYKEELGEHEDAPRVFRLFTKHPMVLGLLDTMLRIGGVEDGIGMRMENGDPRTDDRGVLQINAKLARVLENHLPILDRMGQWLDLPIATAEFFGVPMEQAITAITGARDDADGLDEGLKIISNSAGLRFDVMDKEQQEMNRAYDIWNELQKELRQRDPDPVRSERARRSQHRQFRRLGILPRQR